MPATNSAEEKKKKPAETSDDDDDPRPPDAPSSPSPPSSPTSPRFGFLRKALSGKKKKKKEDNILAAGDIDELDRSLPSENKDWLTVQTDDDDKTEDTEHVKDGDAGKVDDDDKVVAADIAAAEKEKGEGDDEQDAAKKATAVTAVTAAAARNSRVAHQDSITIETRTKPKFKPANFDNDEQRMDTRPSNPVAAQFLTAAKSADTSVDLDESGYETPGDDEDNNGGGAAKKMPVVVERSSALTDPIVEKKKLQVPVAAAPAATAAPVSPNRPGMIGTNFSSSPRSSRPSSDRQLSPNTAAAATSKKITAAAAAPAPAQDRPGMIGTNFSSSSSSPGSRPSSERHLSPKSTAATATATATAAGAAAAGRNYTVHEKHGESWKKLHDMFEKNKSASVPRSMMYDNPSSPRSEGYTKSKAQVGEIDSHRIKSVRELATEWNSRSPPASPTPRRIGGKEGKDKEEKDKGATAESSRGHVDMKMAPLAPQLAQ